MKRRLKLHTPVASQILRKTRFFKATGLDQCGSQDIQILKIKPLLSKYNFLFNNKQNITTS